MTSYNAKVKIKEARQIRRKAEAMWSELLYENEHARREREQGSEPRPSSRYSDYDVIPSADKLVELCVSAFTHLPDHPEAIAESRHILEILDACLSGVALSWEGQVTNKFDYIFDEAYEAKTTFLRFQMRPLSVGQYCFVALYLKNKNDLKLSQKYLDKAQTIDSKVCDFILNAK